MHGIAFEWDQRKDSANRRKHGVGFAEASTVFDDPLSITVPDPDHGRDEDRFVIVGMSGKRRLLIVVHTIRGERIRLISARSATKHERRKYEGSN
jgi:uncharacterized DUF497 family protein